MKRVLIVEDEFMIALALEKQLEQHGCEVVAKVDNAEEALALIEDNHPDLIVMDIKLNGGIDGIEAVRRIREFADIPVIYLTGNGEAGSMEQAEETGPAAILIKPVKPEILKEVLDQVLITPR